jgi:hypothetical protein
MDADAFIFINQKKRKSVYGADEKDRYIRARSNEDVHIYARNVQMTQPIYML